jgi:hypothetical protein
MFRASLEGTLDEKEEIGWELLYVARVSLFIYGVLSVLIRLMISKTPLVQAAQQDNRALFLQDGCCNL